MFPSASPHQVVWFRRLSRAASGFAVLVGSLVLIVGWKLGVTALQSIIPGTTVMVPQTAGTIILAGVALWLVGTTPAHRPAFWIGEVTAALVALSGLTALSEALFHWNLGVAEGLYRLFATSAHAGPGMRPALQTALSFLLMGLALLSLDAGFVLSQILTIAAGAIALTALVGYAYGTPAFYGVPAPSPFTGTAVHAAFTDLVLCLGILAARPQRGLIRLLASESLGGVMARRLLPFAVALPLLLGLLILAGERAHLYGFAFGDALLAVTSVLLLTLVTAVTAGSLDRTDQARKQSFAAEQSLRQRLEAILDIAPVGIVVVEASTERVDANAAAIRLVGHPIVPEAGQSQYARQILSSTGQPLPLDALPTSRALRGETVQDHEMLVAQPSGQRIAVRADAAPLPGAQGEVTGAIATFTDITAEKEWERLREEWTSVITHDLRQPATIIIGYALLLQRHLTRWAGAEEEGKAAAHILTSARHLDRMISDLLDVSRIEAHRLTLSCTAVDLGPLVREIVTRLAQVTVGHLVQVEVRDEPLRVNVDPGRIEQVLGNLLSNAAKYSFPASRIDVTVERQDKSAKVSVTNRGPGIAPAELPHLFQRFYRTRVARVRPEPGIGLGLYIARGLVEAHGGRIWVESVPNLTTKFHFTLPILGAAK